MASSGNRSHGRGRRQNCRCTPLTFTSGRPPSPLANVATAGICDMCACGAARAPGGRHQLAGRRPQRAGATGQLAVMSHPLLCLIKEFAVSAA